MYPKYFKRLFDIISSLVLIILLFPIIVLIFFSVWIFIGFPVIFMQSRPGLNGEVFNMYKFRTMSSIFGKNGITLLDRDRLTKFGQFLRSSSLDELPELWNVLIGEMSLVGPRPLLEEYLSLYSEKQSKRHRVRPGITGWAQVNGRNSISWDEKFELDIWYVNNLSLWLDIKILCLTLKKVLARDGISPDDKVIMPRFDYNMFERKASNKVRIAVISDIHSNLDALTLVLKELKNKNIDITIFLGDILTYGCQPLEVLSMLSKYKKKNPTIFIKGNHDQLYFDLQSSLKKSSYKLPKFVDECVNWTLEKISPFLLKDAFLWHDNYCIGNVYFSHANPFLYGDWSYIEKHQNLLKSFEELNKKNFFAGVFGHSHRQLFIGNKKNTLYEMDTYPSDINNDIEQLIINVGSIGQPRGKGLGYVLLNINNNKLHEASFKKIKIDLRNSIELIKQTKLSEDTKEKLINYLKM
jgi:lipopolysaccharide/colanic/teichoic acid biosynthesis glycosyltransferase/predicted phosphodiesterase